ncbi:MAG TPA: hypothetical protein VGD84_12730 [Pseudonocardiaceae bacterium]
MATVVIAMVGKPVTSGTPNVISLDVVPEPDGIPLVNSTATGTVTARISGGCTIGPNTLRRRTKHTAATQPMKYAPWNTLPKPPEKCMSMNAPAIDSTSASSTAAHHGHPRVEPNAER